jgi:DNA-binding NarL/FixJ family response regulator
MVGGSRVHESLRKSKERIRVLVVTPDSLSGDLMRSALNHDGKAFAIETVTGSSQKIVGELGAHKSQVALICEGLEDGPQAGFKVLQKLRDSQPHVANVMLCRSPKPDCVVNAFCEGARGIFHRDRSLSDLSKCIRTVHQGQYWASNEDLGHIMSALAHLKPLQFNDVDGMPLLTRREEDVVRLVADGLKNGEIAKRLNVAEHSIRNYLYRIFEKLGVSTRVELILYTFQRRERGN